MSEMSAVTRRDVALANLVEVEAPSHWGPFHMLALVALEGREQLCVEAGARDAAGRVLLRGFASEPSAPVLVRAYAWRSGEWKTLAATQARADADRYLGTDVYLWRASPIVPDWAFDASGVARVAAGPGAPHGASGGVRCMMWLE
jgi:hypothetical protein